MTQEQIDFVRDNMNIFTMSIRLTPTQTKMLFEAAVEALKKSVKRLKKQIKEEDDAISEE